MLYNTWKHEKSQSHPLQYTTIISDYNRYIKLRIKLPKCERCVFWIYEECRELKKEVFYNDVWSSF